jgi:hypothetical protein
LVAGTGTLTVLALLVTAVSEEKLPPDVRDTLCQLFEETRDRAHDDPATAYEQLDSARRVTETKVPETDLREQLLHGCSAATDALDENEPALVAEYAAAMARRVDGGENGE